YRRQPRIDETTSSTTRGRSQEVGTRRRDASTQHFPAEDTTVRDAEERRVSGDGPRNRALRKGNRATRRSGTRAHGASRQIAGGNCDGRENGIGRTRFCQPATGRYGGENENAANATGRTKERTGPARTQH